MAGRAPLPGAHRGVDPPARRRALDGPDDDAGRRRAGQLGHEPDAGARRDERVLDVEVVRDVREPRLVARGARRVDDDAVAERALAARDPRLVLELRDVDAARRRRAGADSGSATRSGSSSRSVRSIAGSDGFGENAYSWASARSSSPSLSAGRLSSGSMSRVVTRRSGMREPRGRRSRAEAARGGRSRRPRSAARRRRGWWSRSSAASAASSWRRMPSVRCDQLLAGGRQPAAAAVALEQRHAGLALERGELLGDRRGGVAERVGGGGDRPAGGELAQDAEAADVEHAKAQLTLVPRDRNWNFALRAVTMGRRCVPSTSPSPSWSPRCGA